MATQHPIYPVPDYREVVTVPITTAANAQGDIVDCKGKHLAAVGLSTVWTSAVMSFRAGNSTGTMAPVYGTTGGEFTLNCTSSQIYWISQDVFRGLRYIQPVSGNSTTLVAQTTATSVYFHLAPLP